MCVINGFLFRLLTVKAVARKTMVLAGKMLEKVVKAGAISFTHRHVKEHCTGKSVFATAQIVAMVGENG